MNRPVPCCTVSTFYCHSPRETKKVTLLPSKINSSSPEYKTMRLTVSYSTPKSITQTQWGTPRLILSCNNPRIVILVFLARSPRSLTIHSHVVLVRLLRSIVQSEEHKPTRLILSYNKRRIRRYSWFCSPDPRKTLSFFVVPVSAFGRPSQNISYAVRSSS